MFGALDEGKFGALVEEKLGALVEGEGKLGAFVEGKLGAFVAEGEGLSQHEVVVGQGIDGHRRLLVVQENGAIGASRHTRVASLSIGLQRAIRT